MSLEFDVGLESRKSLATSTLARSPASSLVRTAARSPASSLVRTAARSKLRSSGPAWPFHPAQSARRVSPDGRTSLWIGRLSSSHLIPDLPAVQPVAQKPLSRCPERTSVSILFFISLNHFFLFRTKIKVPSIKYTSKSRFEKKVLSFVIFGSCCFSIDFKVFFILNKYLWLRFQLSSLKCSSYWFKVLFPTSSRFPDFSPSPSRIQVDPLSVAGINNLRGQVRNPTEGPSHTATSNNNLSVQLGGGISNVLQVGCCKVLCYF